MPDLHYEHGPDEPCTDWCYFRLPQRPGLYLVHVHDEGDSCDRVGCTYAPLPARRIRRMLERHLAGDDPLTQLVRRLLRVP